MNKSTGFFVGITCLSHDHPINIQSSKNESIQHFNGINVLLLIHDVSILPKLLAGSKNIYVTIKHFTGAIIGFACQTLFKNWVQISKSLNISLVSTTFSLYMYYDYQTSNFIPISSILNVSFILTQNDAFVDNFAHVIEQYLVCL